MRVAVGSTNPVKIASVRGACGQLWPDREWSFDAIAAPSGVSAQPLSDEEARTGARARAVYAQKHLDADYGVGIEGGLQKVEGYWFNAAWVVVVDRAGLEGMSSTTSVAVPDGLLPLIEAGHELRDACEILWGGSRTAYHGGLIGVLTDGTLDRTGVYVDAVVAALTRFRHPEIFDRRS
ncbi:inosine/xanthosine triphosphatase [Actinoplanes sp. NPDC023714]|uniref:inosine/xanthosine triphosphatase n=1 Tax=Actinoplanes sp. NPDC023714 TaxID=3154322 RepID=UPI0033DE22B5